jgi:hypothetical protein
MPTIGQLEPDPSRRVPDGPWRPRLAGEKKSQRPGNVSKNVSKNRLTSAGPVPPAPARNRQLVASDPHLLHGRRPTRRPRHGRF